MRLTVIQTVPAIEAGGVEQGVLQISQALCNRGHRSIVVSSGGSMINQLQAHGAEHVAMPIHSKSPMALGCIRPLRRLILDTQAHVVHACSRMPAWVAYLALRKIQTDMRPAFLTSVHGLYSVSRYSRIMLAGQRVEVVSKTAQDYVLSNYPGIDPGSLFLNHRGVDPDEFPFGYQPDEQWRHDFFQQYPALRGKFVITLAGRITRLKGHHRMIEAISRLRDRGCDAHGLIVGEVPKGRHAYLQELRDAVRAKGLDGHITFTGHRSDIREVIATSSALVSLSIKPESFGLSVLEAVRLGKPVVAFDHGGVGETLSKVYPAGRVPLGDIEALADRLEEVSKGQVAAPVPTDAFLLSEMLDRTIGMYESLASTARPKVSQTHKAGYLTTQ